MTYRILITGSRTWSDEQAIRDALATIISQHGPENVTVVHGACPTGADALADRIATAWTGLTVEHHPANWRRYGNSAGHHRNAVMVNLGADQCLAFINPCASPKCRNPRPHGSHGAATTADLAEAAGIPTRRYPQEQHTTRHTPAQPHA